jgi:hypothetical protein
VCSRHFWWREKLTVAVFGREDALKGDAAPAPPPVHQVVTRAIGGAVLEARVALDFGRTRVPDDCVEQAECGQGECSLLRSQLESNEAMLLHLPFPFTMNLLQISSALELGGCF